ncbi:MAG TPA: hypothetical protein PLG05_03520 [Bacteroidales bacterium]|nr:hypothetical protein [Bacteroidales bacterium]HOR61120.1 hypothetical protein [Bacteroidales bacterium]HPL04223.1 hypothetical protein [Bacteroidales bacterium]
MYRLFLLLAFFLINFNGFSQSSYMVRMKSVEIPKDSIIKMDFFYIPWSMRFYGTYHEDYVRESEYSSFYSISDNKIIDEFVVAMNLLNVKMVNECEERYFCVKMVIDFYYASGEKKTILNNRNGTIRHNNDCYLSNLHFMKKILDYVPEAKLPSYFEIMLQDTLR